ncbi:MAG: hypothetical protein HOP31_12950 [Ignavibacteria bacterium]|nr:hypothetical protein [Ignavibacteria bacterium]
MKKNKILKADKELLTTIELFCNKEPFNVSDEFLRRSLNLNHVYTTVMYMKSINNLIAHKLINKQTVPVSKTNSIILYTIPERK